MKKKNIVIIVAVLFAAAIVCVFAFLGQRDKLDTVPEITQKSVSVSATQDEYESEPETEPPTAPESGNLTIERPSGNFKITKTDFEEKYSDEFLMDIAGMLGLRFGYEDFEYWDEDPETVVNSLLGNCVCTYKFPFHRIHSEDEEIVKKGNAELDKIFPDEKHSYSSFVPPELLNAYFEDMFGPEARKFKAEDFMTFDEAIAKYGEAHANDHPEGYSQIRSLPESDLLCFYSCAIGFSSYSSYIYDIREINGDYIVYTLGNDEVYYEKFNFDSHQAAAFNQLTWGGSEYVENFVYTFGCTDDGNLYLKSVDKKYLFTEEFEPEYRIVKDTAAVDEVSYLFPSVVVGNLKKGETVHVEQSGVLDDKEVAYVVTEDFAGYVDYDCVERIY